MSKKNNLFMPDMLALTERAGIGNSSQLTEACLQFSNVVALFSQTVDRLAGAVNKLYNFSGSEVIGKGRMQAVVHDRYAMIRDNNAKQSQISYDRALPEKQEGGMLETLERANYVTKLTSEFAEMLKKVISESERVSEVFGKINKVTEGGACIAKLTTGTESIFSAEGLVSAFEASSGMEAVAGIAPLAEPAGWVALVAAAAITAGPAVKNKIDEDEWQQRVKEELQHQKSMKTFEMTEAEANRFVMDIGKEPGKPKENTGSPWRMKYDPVKKNIASYGENAYALHASLPQLSADKLNVQINVLPQMLKIRDEKQRFEKSYLEKISDLQILLMNVGATGGKEVQAKKTYEHTGIAMEVDRRFGTNTLQLANSAAKEVAAQFAMVANKDVVIPDRRVPMKPGASGGQSAGPQSGRTVSIYLNKPMIGNFTVNTQTAKEGIKDFRRKVEEVLLEILNSANVI